MFHSDLLKEQGNKLSSFYSQHQASNSKKVYLKSLILKSTGVYRCEISAEEPDFKTVTGEQKLEVICKYDGILTDADWFLWRFWNTKRNLIELLITEKSFNYVRLTQMDQLAQLFIVPSSWSVSFFMAGKKESRNEN